MRQTAIVVAFFCSIVFYPASLWADCPDGVYMFTDADKKFMTDTVAVLQSAVPPAPEGWSLRDRFRTPPRPGAPVPVWTAPTSACKGANGRPLITGYDVKYFWDAGEKDMTQKQNEIRKKISVVQRTPMAADQQKLANELGNKDRDLRFQARNFEKTDKAQADRLKAEAAVFRKQYDEIYQAHGATLKPELDALRKEEEDLLRGRSFEVIFSILANTQGEGLSEMTPTAAQAGAASAFTGLNLYRVKTTLLVYGGTWKRDTVSFPLAAVFPTGANIHKVHNVVVTASGDPKQVELILSRLDSAPLKALVGK
jgi:hypothetical protein